MSKKMDNLLHCLIDLDVAINHEIAKKIIKNDFKLVPEVEQDDKNLLAVHFSEENVEELS